MSSRLTHLFILDSKDDIIVLLHIGILVIMWKLEQNFLSSSI